LLTVLPAAVSFFSFVFLASLFFPDFLPAVLEGRYYKSLSNFVEEFHESLQAPIFVKKIPRPLLIMN